MDATARQPETGRKKKKERKRKKKAATKPPAAHPGAGARGCLAAAVRKSREPVGLGPCPGSGAQRWRRSPVSPKCVCGRVGEWESGRLGEWERPVSGPGGSPSRVQRGSVSDLRPRIYIHTYL